MRALKTLIIISIWLLGATIIGLAWADETVNSQRVNPKTNQAWLSLDQVKSSQLLFEAKVANTNSQQPAQPPLYWQAPTVQTQVNMTIQGVVSTTQLKQRFTNASDDWQHAVYVFPLPTDAAVSHLQITIGERVIVGEIKTKTAAKRTFEQAKRDGKKAALLSQHRPNLFTTKLANIAPHETIEVELVYFESVKFDSGEFSLTFPMTITPRYMPNDEHQQPTFQQHIIDPETESETASNTDNSPLPHMAFTLQAPAEQKIDLRVNLNAGARLSRFRSLNHSVMMTERAHGEYQLRLDDHQPDKDFTLVWRYENQDLPTVLNFNQHYDNKLYGLLMIMPDVTSDPSDETLQPRELTFVLDTSGSMAGDSLNQAKLAFKQALTSLTAQDKFQVIMFNSMAAQLFHQPVLANSKNKQQAWRHVASLKAEGGTNIADALDLALTPPSSRLPLVHEQADSELLAQIVFLTDGSVGNEAELFQSIEHKIGNKRLFTVGLGSAPNRYFMKQAAELGRGSYHFIASSKHLPTELTKLFTKLRSPVLTDLEFTLAQSQASIDVTPNPIPDVYRGQPVVLNYVIDSSVADNSFIDIRASEKNGVQPHDATLSGRYQQTDWQQYLPDLINQSTGHLATASAQTTKLPIPALASVWAKKQVANLNQQMMLGGDREQLKHQITNLGLNYRLVTPFTSFVAVEQQVSRPNSIPASEKRIANSLPSGQRLPQTALGLQASLNLAFLILVFCSLLLWLRHKLKAKLACDKQPQGQNHAN
ncbi:marine proteobacterial sortase target protein [Saccharobesus litoralis]|uniref:Marine proteobacterial sortase target protein n=1 Tax=Saccharobesus litoralis TaxID=2172099 RepID=A0A2S0VSI2_9ALTE|nr:marine proteobacterial sortase target protein [Saccharobesus litoralis]AWB67143.1 marine proteobacterial sortase target protein [Saccharobesus litoralis]